jgi:hypothetical protein
MTARHTDSLFVKSNSEAPAQYDAYLGSAVVALLIADIEALSLIARQFRLNGNVGLGFLDCHLQKYRLDLRRPSSRYSRAPPVGSYGEF